MKELHPKNIEHKLSMFVASSMIKLTCPSVDSGIPEDPLYFLTLKRNKDNYSELLVVQCTYNSFDSLFNISDVC